MLLPLWKILKMRVNDEQYIKTEATYTYRDNRDDRVYTFFDLEPNQTVTYRVFVNAAYTGRFYLPALSCEAMYDSRFFARQKGHWFVVKKKNSVGSGDYRLESSKFPNTHLNKIL